MVLPTLRKHWIVLVQSMFWPTVAAVVLLVAVDGPLWDFATGSTVQFQRGAQPVALVAILFWLSVAGLVLGLVLVYIGAFVGMRSQTAMLARAIVLPSAVVLVLVIFAVKGPGGPIAEAVGGDVRVVITLLALGILGLAGWWTWFNWKASMMTVTDQRVILEDGVIIKKTKVIPLDRVQDVSTTQNLLGRFMDYGSLEIDTAGAIPNELFTYAAHPEMLRDQVFVLSEQLRRGL